jgi:hypothetical protein
MASFTDQILQSRPYVQQLPLEAMAQVGMYKQQKYEEGVQKIQSYIDNVAGMDIIHDSDKEYLQSKLNELGGKLKTVAAGDFSNFQLVNSVGGMATQIAKDPTVKNAVNSTAWYRKQTERIQKDIDDGKSSPDNIYKFQKQADQWLNTKKAGQKFSADYTPYFDIFKFAKETFDAVLPDGYTFDQIYQLGPDGKPLTVKSKDKNGKITETLVYSPTMTRLEQEGRLPKKVKETISQIFSDPRVSRQLGITGEYNYKGYDGDALVAKVLDQKNNLVNDYTEQVDDQIDAIQQRLETIKSNYDLYVETAKSNPDAIRAKLYEDDVYSRYSTMFGQIKTKTLSMDNPAWRAQFDMQKEANAQSRWAQTEERQRREFRETKDLERDKLAQAWNIAVLNASTKGAGKKGAAKGFGIPEETGEFTQGQQFSDIDVIYLADKDYRNAAENFSKSSTNLVWDNGFSNIPGNQNRLSALVRSGKSSEEAKYTILKELADKRGVPIEDFLATYTTKVITNYNNLTPEQRQKNPSIVDQYNNFRKSLRAFDTQKGIRNSIDAQTEAIYGKSTSRDIALKDIKDQKIKVYGKDYDMTKDDIYDLSVYIKGRLSVLGTAGGVDEGVRKASNAALGRLKARGKEELADALIESNLGRRAYRGGPISFVVDAAKGLFGLKDAYRQLRYVNDTDDPFKQVEKVFNVIDNDKFAGGIKAKADVIRKNYNIQPNLRSELFTGDAETDKDLLYMVKGFTGGYGTKRGGRINSSEDFDEFRKAIAGVDDPSKISLDVQPTIGPEGDVRVEIVAFNKDDMSRAGGMTIQPDEAEKIGVDINTLYETREVASLRNKINYNQGKSSKGDPSEKSTYIQGDVYFDDNDFAQLNRSGFNAKGNVVRVNGVYYPYIYVTDGQTEKVRQLNGSPNLGAAVGALLSTNPTFAKMILTER